jgi:CDP-diacylglycerol---glycerol-3-phosphate 3-phosphatidyltransferase
MSESGPSWDWTAESVTSATPRRDMLRRTVDPLARKIADAGLTANMVTLIGFGIAVVAGVLAAVELWVLAGVVGMIGAAFDTLDGAVARVTGTTGRLGAFMDSTFDRWGEAIGYVGIVAGATRAGVDAVAWLAALAMASAFLVSYARARAESLGFAPGKGMAAVGLAPREVRTVVLGVGLIVAGLLGVGPNTSGGLLLALTLLVIAVLATITVMQRILFVQRQAASEDSR